MKVTVQFEAQLQQAAGVREMAVDAPAGCSALTVIRQVAEHSADGLRARLLSADGAMLASVLMFVNEIPVASDAALSHELSDGDTVLLLPPISGG